ncbi:hypothetical protein ACUR5C_14790 [Aliikangiella sp. IMCC44653]
MRANVKKYLRLIVVSILATLSVAMLVILTWQLYWTSDLENWIYVDAQVVDIQVKRKSASIEYKYHLNGDSYIGNRLAFLSEGTILDKDTITQSFNAGQILQVLVNPNSPDMSVVLHRNIAFEYIRAYLIMALLSGLLAFFLWKRKTD